MDYQRVADTIVARIDKGEEIQEKLKELCLAEGVKLASVNALGAVSDFTIGVFDVAKKQYYSNDFTGLYEIVSLTGSVTVMDGAYYAHLHMSAGDEKGQVVGGHLNRAVVSATCELFLTLLPGAVERTFSPEVGLNLLDFHK